MARGEIGTKQSILLLGRPRLARGRNQVAVAAQVALMRVAGDEFAGADEHRHARRAIGAARAIGDRLAAPEPDAAARVVPPVRPHTAAFGDHLAPGLARQIPAMPPAGDKHTPKTKK